MLESSALIQKTEELLFLIYQWPAHFPQPEPKDTITCEVLCFEVQIVEFVDIAYIHLFLVQFSLIEVL